MSKFAIVERNDKGISAKVTQDVVLKRGQRIFFNDYEEGIKFLGEKGIITQEEVTQKLRRTQELDREYGRETLYSLRAGKDVVETATEKDASLGNKGTL